MAACVLRRLASVHTLRCISRNVGISGVYRANTRRIHISPIVARKYFTEKHEWLDIQDGEQVCTVGITEYAQDKLGDIVYIQLPEVGDTVEADGEAGVLESVKAASDIYSPVSGEVTAANDAAVEDPKLVNNSPYDAGWLFKVSLSNPDELKELMDEDGYKEFLTTCD